MSGQAYAEKNAGRRIRVYVSAAGPNKRIEKYPYCRVIGYDDHNHTIVYVEFENKQLQITCTPAHLIHTFVRTAPSKDPDGRVWHIGYEHVRFLRATKTTKKRTIAKPYPNLCTKCHAPARSCGLYIICSNISCKANKKYKKAIFSTIPRLHRIRCATCRGYAISVGAVRGKSGTTEWRFQCAKKHSWNHTPKENDIVSGSQYDKSMRDTIWRAGTWQQK